MDLAVLYHRCAEWLVSTTRTTPELLHVDAGLALWLASALLLRRPLSSLGPLAVLMLAAAGNELMDRLFWGRWERSTPVDLLNGCGWPLILCIALNVQEHLRARGRERSVRTGNR